MVHYTSQRTTFSYASQHVTITLALMQIGTWSAQVPIHSHKTNASDSPGSFLDTSMTQQDTFANFSILLGGFGPTSGGDDPDITAKEIFWASSRSWKQFISVSANPQTSIEDLRKARKLGWVPVMTMPSNPARQTREHTERGKPLPNMTEAVAAQRSSTMPMKDTILVNTSTVDALGEQKQLVWEYLQEDDSCGTGVAHDLLTARDENIASSALPLSSTYAHQKWTEYLDAAKISTRRDNLSAGFTMSAKFGFPTSAHAVAASGADILILERMNDDVGSLAVGLPFTRGAAAQHGASWGIDFSLWWGVINGCVQDLPADIYVRALLLAYVGGAHIVEMEGCGWMTNATASGGPNAIAHAVDTFGTFVADVLPPSARGVHDARVALVLPTANGWSENPSWARTSGVRWNIADVPLSNRGERGIDGIFSIAYPGTDRFSYFAFPFGLFKNNTFPPPSPFARSAITPTYAPNANRDVLYRTGPLPFGKFSDRNEAHEWMHASNANPALYRPMVDTHWGDIIDVLVNGSVWVNENSSASARIRFPPTHDVIVWTGDGTLPAESATSMRDFIASTGRTLVVAAGTVTPAHESLTGVAFTGGLLAARAWEWLAGSANDSSTLTPTSTPTPERKNEALLVAEVADIARTNVSVVARSVPEGIPLVVRHGVGSGAVITCLVPWFEGSGGMSQLATLVLERVIQQVQPVSIAQPLLAPPLAWTSSVAPLPSTADGGGMEDEPTVQRIVVAANNAGGVWAGALHVEVPSWHVDTHRRCTRAACRVLFSGVSGTNTVECTPSATRVGSDMAWPRERTAGRTVVTASARVDARDVVVFGAWCTAYA
eukprot:m.343222 g.343222  ORF g.343222 m.343222 type:complete len:834 (+) comp20629_c0_seq2:362-2863(+)